MKLFDTHAHIMDDAFSDDREGVLSRMREAGVELAMAIGDPSEPVSAIALAEQHDFLYAAGGVHPHNARLYTEEIEKNLLAELAHEKCVCLGEIGLDYHYDLSPREVQREVFARQLALAKQLNLPAQLHIREAHGDSLDILRGMKAELPPLILHCCTASWESVKVYLNLGAYISLSGAVTFKNAPKLREVAENTPRDRLLVETDCPYMAPVPLRGRRNEPAFVAHTLAHIASIRGEDPEETAAYTFENGRRILNI